MKKKLIISVIAAGIVMVLAQQGITMADYVLPRITSIQPGSFVALN
jgi:hypothetical protein